MIAEETIQEILERSSISEIIGETVQLKRAGVNAVGLCPFHTEKTPSFNVREQDGYFHCFGCGQSGNVFKFLMEIKGLSFPEAVEELAGRYGIKVKLEGRGKPTVPHSQKEEVYEVNAVALEFFLRSLRDAPPPVKGYLEKRNLGEKARQGFRVGFAPNSRTGLYEYLRSRGVPDERIFSAALARRNEEGQVYDVFRGRLIFPVFVDQKRIAGFGGRIIPNLFDEDALSRYPKYLNSPETTVYQKSKILYGVPHALQTLRSSGECFIVEGYMDVVSMHQAEVTNALATCGTALTEMHVKKLSQLVKRVTLLFDGDDAGRAAAGKAFPTFINVGIEGSAAFLPAEDDPDTIALKYGTGSAEYLSQLPRRGLLDCHIEFLLGKYGAKEISELGSALKGKLAIELGDTLRRVGSDIERSEYIERAALLLRIEPAHLTEVVKRSSVTPTTLEQLPPSEDEEASDVPNVAISDLPNLDRELLLCAIALKEELPQKILLDGDLCAALRPRTLAFIEGISAIFSDESLSSDERKVRSRELLQRFGPSWTTHWRRAHELREDRSVDPKMSFFECSRSARKAKLQRTIKEIDREIALAKDDSNKLALVQQKVALSKRMSEITS